MLHLIVSYLCSIVIHWFIYKEDRGSSPRAAVCSLDRMIFLDLLLFECKPEIHLT